MLALLCCDLCSQSNLKDTKWGVSILCLQYLIFSVSYNIKRSITVSMLCSSTCISSSVAGKLYEGLKKCHCLENINYGYKIANNL